MEEVENRTLMNNGIKQFIIRIDLLQTDNISFEAFANAFAPHYSGLVKQILPHININLDNQNVESRNVAHYSIKIGDGVQIKMDPIQNCIIFEANHYQSNEIYKETMSKLFSIMKDVMDGKRLIAKRIGMRYINYFSASSIEEIKGILNEHDAESIIYSIEKENINRVVFVEEKRIKDKQIRIQYGVPNKYYPNPISSLDILLDIDVYACSPLSVEEWNDNVQECNHLAYDTFKQYVQSALVEKLK